MSENTSPTSSIIIRPSKLEDNQAIVDLFIYEKILHPEEILSPIVQKSQSIFANEKISETGDMYNVYDYYNKFHDSCDIEKLEMLKKNPNLELRRFWVAEDITNGKIVGIIASIPSTIEEFPDHLELIRLTVHPNYKKHRIGSQLKDIVENYSKSHGLKGVCLTTLLQMITANYFYKKYEYKLLKLFKLEEGKDLDIAFYYKDF